MKCGVQLSHVLLFLKKMLLVKENHQIHMCTQIEHNIFGIKNRNFPKLVRKHKNRLFFFFFFPAVIIQALGIIIMLLMPERKTIPSGG